MEAMDFMDPKRRKQYSVMLFVGYALIGCAILLVSLILLFVAYGFGYKNGQVIQSGLLFLSSTPNPAQIFIDGKRYKGTTNTKLVLPAGTYHFALTRAGYREWQRTIAITGGEVQTYAYPFFFPLNLTTNTKHEYITAPPFVAQSPDRRWLLVANASALTSFDVYDLNNPKKEPVAIDLPAAVLSPASGSQNLQLVSWADDNTHVLLLHTFDGKSEYILLDRVTPAQTVNLSKTLSLPENGAEVRLSNLKYDQYVVLDTTKHILSRASLSTPTLQTYVNGVLAYTTYSDNTVLYATPDPLAASKVDIDLYDGNTTYTIRRDAANTMYLLDLTTYNGDLYVATSAESENTAYVYKSPVAQITNPRIGSAIPVQVFSIKAPNYLAFSSSAQYILFENGTKMAVYDAENEQGFTYSAPDDLDSPQAHALWMDGARLLYVSKGQIVASDYDGQNRQVLVTADPRYGMYFNQSYKTMYSFVTSASDKSHELLTSTSLRTLADQ